MRLAGTIFLIVSTVPFLVQFNSLYMQYSSKVTATYISYEKHESIRMPTITICPKHPFKANVSMTDVISSEEAYLENTLAFDNIFEKVGL